MKQLLTLFLLSFLSLHITAQTETPSEVWGGTDDIDIDWYDANEDAFEISTAAQLAGLAKLVNDGTQNFSGKTITLTDDIVLNEKVLNDDGTLIADVSALHEWTAIGTEQNSFAGNFDGGGHTISGLYINKANSDNQGLFGYVSNDGTIQNVGVVDSYVKGNMNVGGVVGYAGFSTVSGCYNTGTVSGESECVGGVAGFAISSIVSGCYNMGMVTGERDFVGGVAGFAISSIVSGCYNMGMVSGDDSVGGVVGFADSSSVSGCYNTGTVSGERNYVGGVVGYASSSSTSSTVSGCYNTGKVSGIINVGCVIGLNYSMSISNSDFLAGVNGDISGIGSNLGNGTSSPLSASALVEAMNTNLFNDDASGDLWKGEASYDATSRTITLPTFGTAISISLKDLLTFYKVTLSTDLAGGSISANMEEAAEGETVTLTAIPDEGYKFEKWCVTYQNGEETVEVTVTEDTFTMPAADVTVTATFKLSTYTITVTEQIEGGKIEASKTSASMGDEITLTATPDEGYEFEKWSVTYGESGTVEVSDEGIFKMPAANVTVTATFAAIDYKITVTPPTGGSIAVADDKKTAHVGDEITLTATPDEGYEFVDWSVTYGNENTPVTVTDNTFTMPAADVTVTATFVAVYNITVTPPTGGNISVSAETAHEGDEITLTATPAEGYKFVSWNVTTDNGTVDVTDSEGIYTFTMPAANVTVTATFTAIDYNITVTPPTGGTISVSAETAHVGDLITLTATPNANYEFTSWSVTYQNEEGATVAVEVTNNTFTMPAADVTVSAVFTYVPPTYTITVTQPSTGGSISADKKEATEGETVTLSYTEHSNYDFAGWTVTRDDDGSVISTSSNTFRMPASDVTVTAQFRYDPPYIPSYYDIYFDGNENDSVRYDCSDTNVREGGTFSFTVEVAAGYDPETLVVEYKRGRGGSWREVTPNSSGRYRITNVHADIYVRSCVEPIEDPTAIEQVGDGKSTVRCDGKRIRITTPEPQTMHIINVGGRLVRTAQLPAGDTEVNDLPQGFYVVILSDGTRTKALIN